MSRQVIHLERLDDKTAAIVAAAFPSYRGRKFKIEVSDNPIDVRSYWDGGSRDYFVFVDLKTMRSAAMPAQSAFDPKIAGAESVKLPADFACVQHSIFCGKDCGITIMIGSANAAPLLPAPAAELTAEQKLVLQYTAGRKSSYAGRDRCDMCRDDMESDRRFNPSKPEPISREQWEIAKASLVSAGYLNKAGAITAAGKNAIANERSIY
jgi:hypothetical protein